MDVKIVENLANLWNVLINQIHLLSKDVPVSQPMPKVGGRPTPHFYGLEGLITLL